MVLRNRTLPVIDLGRALGREPGASAGDANVLIVAVAGQWGGLEVDRLGERMDVMLKPPEGLLAGMPGIDGTTLLGDGRVLIVLDLHEIFGNAGGLTRRFHGSRNLRHNASAPTSSHRRLDVAASNGMETADRAGSERE